MKIKMAIDRLNMSYLFEFDKDYHSSSDSDYNPDTDSQHSTDGEYESDVSESELPTTPVKERSIKMPLAPVKKRPIKMPFQVESNSNVRPIKMTFQLDADSNESCRVKPVRPVRERKQPIRYQA